MLLNHQPPRLDWRALLQRARDARLRRRQHATPDGQPASRPAQAEPDVVLDVSRLHVGEIDLRIDELDASVALNARVLDLLRLDVGVDARLRGVGLKIDDVDAQALLKVRLENLAAIVDRVLGTIDRHPEIVEHVTRGLGASLEDLGAGTGKAVGELGGGAGSALEGLGKAVRPPDDGD